MTEIDIRVERDGEVARIALEGELDLASAKDVERALLGAEEDHPHQLILDLRGLRFIDSTGIRLLLSADSRAREDSRRLTIVRGPAPVERVFKIARLDQRLEFVDDPPAITEEPPS